MTPWEIIKLLESDNSRLFKEEVVTKHINNKEFVKGLQFALNPLITFGTREVQVKKEPDNSSELRFTFTEFEKLVYKLQNRE